MLVADSNTNPDVLGLTAQIVSAHVAHNNVAAEGGISHDSTAAVAEYIRDDMLEILMHSQATDELP